MLKKLKKMICCLLASALLLSGVPGVSGEETGMVVTAEAATTVKLNTKSVILVKGETYKLKISGLSKSKKVNWSASNKNVKLTKSKDTKSCTVKGLKYGTTKITATVGSKKYTCTVKVIASLAQVKLGKISTKGKTVTLTWNKVSGATDYYVYYKKSGGKWKKIASVSGSKTTYTHKSSSSAPLTAGKKYYYTVRAYNKNTKKMGPYNTKGLAITIKLSIPVQIRLLNRVWRVYADGREELRPFSDEIKMAVSDVNSQNIPFYRYRFFDAEWTSSNPEVATVKKESYYCIVNKKSLGTTVITASPYDIDRKISVTVTVDYGEKQKFADNFVRNWINKNLNDTMTQYEKMVAIAKYVGSFPYGGAYDWVEAMKHDRPIDCFATRQMVAYMCTAAGIPAMACDSSKDHGKTIVKADQKFYEVLTGYTYSGIERYSIWELSNEELREDLAYYGRKVEDFVPSNLAICDPSPHTCWDTKVSMANPEIIMDVKEP